MDYFTANPRLIGVLEWIIFQGGTVNVCNAHIAMGRIGEYKYRYFISEGWIGLADDSITSSKWPSFETMRDFQEACRAIDENGNFICHECENFLPKHTMNLWCSENCKDKYCFQRE